jgi:cardiolipin synthase (CMP-forming)
MAGRLGLETSRQEGDSSWHPRYTLAEMPKWVNLPNSLTLLRLVLAPLVVAAILTHHPRTAFALFFVASWTDVLDGMAARRSGSSTQVGAYLDPIADKCLMSGCFLALAVVHQVPWWVVGIVLGRDVYILLAAAILMRFTGIRRFPPSVWGKLSTFAQIATVGIGMGGVVLQLPVLDAFSAAMLWVCAALALWSGLHYTWRGLRGTTAGNRPAEVR